MDKKWYSEEEVEEINKELEKQFKQDSYYLNNLELQKYLKKVCDGVFERHK